MHALLHPHIHLTFTSPYLTSSLLNAGVCVLFGVCCLDVVLCPEAGYKVQRALYESVSMSFLTQLGDRSAKRLHQVIKSSFTHGLSASALSKPPRRPGGRKGGKAYVVVEQYWLKRGPLPPRDPAKPNSKGSVEFVVVPSVRRHIQNLARAVLSSRHPVLLQGPTSSGKTTMVAYVGWGGKAVDLPDAWAGLCAACVLRKRSRSWDSNPSLSEQVPCCAHGSQVCPHQQSRTHRPPRVRWDLRHQQRRQAGVPRGCLGDGHA